MMKAMLSAVGIALAVATISATAGAQETGTHAPSAEAPADGRASLSERVRGLLAESGVEVGLAPNSVLTSARSHRELKVSWEADKAALPSPAAVQSKNAAGRVA